VPSAGAGGSGPGPAPTEDPGGHCGPTSLGTESTKVCFDYQPVSIPSDPDLLVVSGLLSEPIQAGTSYALSIEVLSSNPTIEFWGTDTRCGDGLELLAKFENATGVVCTVIEPQGSYSEVLAVMRGGEEASLFEYQYCGAAGHCEE
jgi:hypothetical protein